MCIFCKIVNGEIPSYKVYEDENFLAFLDISQTTKGHTLVVPKRHCDNLLSLESSLASQIFPIVQKIALSIKEITKAEGFNILNNCGEVAGQSVMHFHIHIIPRYANDSFNIQFSSNSFTNEELNDLAGKIKNTL